MIDLNTCKVGDKLRIRTTKAWLESVSNPPTDIVTYMGKTEGVDFPHNIEYSNGSKGSRNDNGCTYCKNRKPDDPDVLEIISFKDIVKVHNTERALSIALFDLSLVTSIQECGIKLIRQSHAQITHWLTTMGCSDTLDLTVKQTRTPLPEGTIIRYLDLEAEVVKDIGTNDIEVIFEDDMQMWKWVLGGETCVVSSYPKGVHINE